MIEARVVVARYLDAVGKKPKAEPPSSAHADQAARESATRREKLKKALSDVNSLSKKLEGKGGAKNQKAFDQAYDEIHELGEKAADAADKLLKEYGETISQGTRGEEKVQREATIEMLERALRSWKSNEIGHFQQKDNFRKMQRAEETFGYAAHLETYVGQVSKALKGDHIVDDKWAR